jgi:hypothetical protein
MEKNKENHTYIFKENRFTNQNFENRFDSISYQMILINVAFSAINRKIKRE